MYLAKKFSLMVAVVACTLLPPWLFAKDLLETDVALDPEIELQQCILAGTHIVSIEQRAMHDERCLKHHAERTAPLVTEAE
jgi:hypothetical protein